MSHVNLYYLVPESKPSNQWIRKNDDLQAEKSIVTFMKELEAVQECVRIENYNGFYDSKNISNFLRDFETLEDYYPKPVFNLLRKKMSIWNDWRVDQFQLDDNQYDIFNQRITDHTFIEISEHKQQKDNEGFILVNHKAHKCRSSIKVTINGTTSVTFQSVEDSNELFDWFAENRIPAREFQVIDKHGENRTEVKTWNSELASPLRCNRQHAKKLLKRAIGDKRKELFNYDENNEGYFIVFKHEGENPQNMYHGYHVDTDSNEIPRHIKEKLLDK